MLKKEGKGIYYDTSSGHYTIRFTYQKYKQIKIVAKIRLEDGTIRYAENKAEAKLAIAQYISNGGRIDKIILHENTSLLKDCIKEYIEHCEILGKKRTDLIEKYCYYFLDFIVNYRCKNNITAGEIIPNDFYKYVAYRQKCKIMTKTKKGDKWTGRYISNATIIRELNSIKGLFKYLVQIARVIKENPCCGLKKLKIQAKIKQPPTKEQEDIILKLASEDFDFFVMLCLYNTLGLRKNEVLNLKHEDVHLKSNNIFPYGYIDITNRKNNKFLRLPLSPELQHLLRKVPVLSEYVFTNPKTGTKYTNRYKKLNRILEKVGIKDLGVGFHIFRHNTASNLEQSGVEASVISEILGNTSGVVRTTYLNQGVKRKQEVISLNSERIRKHITA